MLGVRTRAALYLVMIFTAGFLSGSLASRWMERWSVSADAPVPAAAPEVRKGAVRWFTKGLDLDAQQEAQLSKILEETRAAYKDHELQIESIKQHARARIREILTDQQKIKYDQLLADRARKEAEKERRKSR